MALARERPAGPATAEDACTPIGHILRDYRRELGLTQGALAHKSGLSISLISKIEVCLRAVNSETITKVAPVLELSHINQHRLMRLTDPYLLHLSQSPTTPTHRELSLLDTTSHPACYLTPGLYVVSAANTAFTRTYPGLQVGDSLVEWHLLSPWAKAVLPDWEAETHRWVRACREALTGFTPIADIERIKKRYRHSRAFDRMWNTRAPESIATREILRLRDPESASRGAREMFVHLSLDENHLLLTPYKSAPGRPDAAEVRATSVAVPDPPRCSCGSARRATASGEGLRRLVTNR
ncbi:helix-turn-helix domain-containing protein [Nocardia suismassiliense]|uniref:helix-turn-helix domain-containing protein n=1 Tax=Nocardia suismassiliense TaxID=2077092 RepID=UPI00131EDE1C|nr:helix-turn-helix domain-containing protein [Nocardia suismassiliense]